jgi:hypothetical protein
MTVNAKPGQGFHPSLPAFLFLIWALLIPLFEGESMVNADGDPSRHIRHGETILAQRDVIRNDPFSFTKPGEPFVGFEYGSQVLLTLGHKLGGTPGMVVVATIVIAATLALLLWWLLRRRVDPLLAVTTTMAVAVLTNIHWLARPHIFSWPLTIALLAMLESERLPRWPWFAGLFVLWVNLHGAFVFGWILIGMYLAGHVAEWWWSDDSQVKAAERKRATALLGILGITVLASLANPYGWHLPQHVVQFFGDPWLRTLTQEFLSPDFHSRDLYPFLFALLGLMALLAHRPRPHWTHLMVIMGTVGMALISQRNIVQFGLIAVPLIALDQNDFWSRRLGSTRFATNFAVAARSGIAWPWVAATVALLLGLAASRGRVGDRELIPDGFSPVRFPVAAVASARENGVQGRIFNEFIWSGYILYAWPGMKVFIDGGSDFYGGELLRTHRDIMNLQTGWRDSLDAWKIDLTLTATGRPITEELLREPQWVPRFCDSTAVLLSRPGASAGVDSVPRTSCHAVRRKTDRP